MKRAYKLMLRSNAMHRLIAILLAILATLALARDIDQMSEAIRRGNTLPCYAIQSPDLRAACFAEVRQSAYLCMEIKNRDEDELCLARTMRDRPDQSPYRQPDLGN